MSEVTSSTPADLVHWSESYLERYGPDTAKGVGDLRGDEDSGHRVMLQAIRDPGRPVTLLDFGCGLSTLNDVLLREGPAGVTYAGLDISDRFLAASRHKYPSVTYYQLDVLTDDLSSLPTFDYIVMNGIFTYRGDHTEDEMWAYVKAVVTRVFPKAREGLALSFVTKLVDWERDNLFHVPVDPLLDFLSREVSRHIVIRQDYGLYEYIAYVYRDPSDPERRGAKRLLDPRPGQATT